MTIVKQWYYVLKVDGGRIRRYLRGYKRSVDGVVEVQTGGWDKARDEAAALGTQAELEEIELTQEPGATMVVTGNRKYVYADEQKRETTVSYKQGDDYYAMRKQVEASLLNRQANINLVRGGA